MNTWKIVSALIASLACMTAAAGEPVKATEDSGAPPEAIAKWRGMRFGLFVHWGPVSLTGREIGWSRGGERRGHRTGHGTETPVEVYDNLYKEFNPVKFDADEWVAIAKEAGMRYLVFTTKHHDGLCNFDSKLTGYKITSPESPYGKDIAGQLADACHAADFPLGWYYSPPDWHDANYRNGDRHAQYIKYMHGQIEELLTNYGKVDILWFDGLGGTAEDWDAGRLLPAIRRFQPGIIINNRCGLPADHDTPEQRVGGFMRDRPWETCMTICRQWAWKPGDTMKSRKQCIQTLLQVVGGDGNLLFNVGPMPDGRIEDRQVERLKEMGQWLARYGDGVYGTRGGPFKPGKWGASTCKENRIYLYVMNWPKQGPFELPAVEKKIASARLLSGGTLDFQESASGISVDVPVADRDEVATVIELTVDGTAFDIAPVDVAYRSDSLAYGKKATASNVYRKMNSQHGPQMVLDDDLQTRWATDSGTSEAWLEVDLGQPREVVRVSIDEPAEYRRIQSFQLQYLDGESWKTFYEGKTVGPDWSTPVAPVTAQRFRLNILRATDGPTIWEFQLGGAAE